MQAIVFLRRVGAQHLQFGKQDLQWPDHKQGSRWLPGR
jgi:hypothetical protein